MGTVRIKGSLEPALLFTGFGILGASWEVSSSSDDDEENGGTSSVVPLLSKTGKRTGC